MRNEEILKEWSKQETIRLLQQIRKDEVVKLYNIERSLKDVATLQQIKQKIISFRKNTKQIDKAYKDVKKFIF